MKSLTSEDLTNGKFSHVLENGIGNDVKLKIYVENLSKNYGEVKAVRDLSFSAASGEILALVGPNGAGKTTTMRCMCGIIPPASGRVGINDCELAKDPVRFKQRVAYVSSETKFFDYLTVREHLSFFARLYKCGDKKEHIDKLLSIMELSEKQQHLPGSLSRGMKQKLMLACALVHDPEVMILDEPFTGLDPLAIRMLKDLLRDRANAGAIVIISSHLLNMVEELVDRILILQKGRKLVHGTAEEISTRLPDLRDNAGLEDIFIYATTHDDLPAFNSDGVIDE